MKRNIFLSLLLFFIALAQVSAQTEPAFSIVLLGNDKIADALHISFRTVETHRKNIMQKTKAHNLAGLLKYAYGRGLLK